jgi:hypothetical protein
MANNQPGIIMPEIIIYKSLVAIFNIVKQDFLESTDEEQSMLFNFFGKDENGDFLNFEQFNYFEQAKETFIQKSPQVNLGYNLEVASMGSIHILLPGENGQPLTIGADENYQPYIQNQTEFKATFSQRFDSTYNILITSENTFEVILIYNLLKSSILALNYHFELAGLRLPKTSGQDLNVQSDLVPTHIFHRSLMLNFFYELNVSDFFYKKLIKNFKITGIAENE